MRLLILLLALGLAQPALAAQDGSAAAQTEAKKAETDARKAEAEAKKAEAEAEKAEGEYSCKYYDVKLPADWKAIMPPTEKQGMVNAIFAASSGTPVVTIIVGPSGGADARTIAGMFAEQFKAPKPPVEKNGAFSFSFPMQTGTAQAWVAAKDKDFMVTTISGNMGQARNFIKNSIKSEEWGSLLPQ